MPWSWTQPFSRRTARQSTQLIADNVGVWYSEDGDGEEYEVDCESQVVTLLVRANSDEFSLSDMFASDSDATEFLFPDGMGQAFVIGRSRVSDHWTALEDWSEVIRDPDAADEAIPQGTAQNMLYSWETSTNPRRVGGDLFQRQDSITIPTNLELAVQRYPIIRDRAALAAAIEAMQGVEGGQWRRMVVWVDGSMREFCLSPPGLETTRVWGPFVGICIDRRGRVILRCTPRGSQSYRWEPETQRWGWVDRSTMEQDIGNYPQLNVQPGVVNLSAFRHLQAGGNPEHTMLIGRRTASVMASRDNSSNARINPQTEVYHAPISEDVAEEVLTAVTSNRNMFWGGDSSEG